MPRAPSEPAGHGSRRPTRPKPHSGVRIVLTSRKKGFSTVPHDLQRDKRLSYRARGVLQEMLSHTDGWGTADPVELADGTKEGRDAVRAALAELEQIGYLTRRKVRLANGQTITETTVYDVPQARSDEATATRQPATDSQDLAPPAETNVSAGDTRSGFPGAGTDQGEQGLSAGDASYGFSGAGTDLRKGEFPQVAPATDSQGPIREDQEDQEKTKEISQSARVAEAVRTLRNEYGLTEPEAITVWKTAEARSPREVRHPLRYLESMRRDPITGEPKADLADIVEAVQLHSTPATSDNDQPEHHPQPGAASNRTVAEAITAANPDRQPTTPAPLHSVDAPVCAHGQPNGAIYNPTHGGPSCGMCRMHAIACKTADPDTCPGCRDLTAAGWVPPPDWTPPARWTPPERQQARA